MKVDVLISLIKDCVVAESEFRVSDSMLKHLYASNFGHMNEHNVLLSKIEDLRETSESKWKELVKQMLNDPLEVRIVK